MLLVEDVELLAFALDRGLAENWDITAVSSAEEAVQAMAGTTFDAVLTDVSLPGMSGIELLRAIRARDLDVPVVLMTGFPALTDAQAAVELGALRYVVKPFHLTEVEAALARAAAVGRLARARRAMIDSGEVCPESPRVHDVAGLIVRFESALATLRLDHQPIVNPRTMEVHAYEALMRTDEESMPSPMAVLSAAHQLDRSLDLGRVVRSRAAASLARIPTHVSLFVNVQARELGDPALYTACPLAPFAKRVVLEVTEREPIDSVRGVVEKAGQLRAAGFRIAIDDLGAGYAGLSALATLEPDVVKVDMSIVRGIHTSVVKQRTMAAVVNLCREMGSKVVAEGVEVTGELAQCAALGVDLVQGYLIARPGPLP